MSTASVSVRFPKDLHHAVKAAAEEDRRSLNAEILTLIEAGLATRERGTAR